MRLILLLFLATLAAVNGYHILCIFPIPSHSHHTLGKGVVDALLNSGNTVTWVTPYPDKVGKNPPKTLKIVDISEVQEFVQGVDMTDSKKMARGLAYIKEFSYNLTRTVATKDVIVDLLVNTQYDAVVTETFFNDVIAGIAAVQQVPWITLTGQQITPMLEKQVDEVRSISTIPIMFNQASVPMSFKERAINAMVYIFMEFTAWRDLSLESERYENLFKPIAAARNVPLPPFQEAYYNVSILFVNSHESLSLTFSTPPNVINIAGYHIDENPPPLPKDLQDLLDNSKQGVIYFSMGSVVKSATFKASTRQALLAVFAKLPYTVLWKFEEAVAEKLPPNVHVRPWMPQTSILAHPNVKVFITHGGQLSSLEAVQAGVPLLALPVFGDQPSNAERARKAGYGLTIPFNEHMAPEVEEKLKELLRNPSYSERAKYLSKIFRARPTPPSKLISHYVELAIETKGAYHLRSLSLQYTWIQRWMLDVILALLAALVALITIPTLVVRACYRKLCGKSKSQEKNKKKN